MATRAHNFFAGPSGIPTEVLEQAQKELLDFEGTGVSVMEISHRSKEFTKVIKDAESNLKEILGIGDDYSVLFLQGGATQQFVMMGMNALEKGDTADYIVSGKWASRAQEEGSFWGNAKVVASSKDEQKSFYKLPQVKTEDLSDDAKFLHFTSNNTIFGTQWWDFPTPKDGVGLVCDMSSDFLSRDFDMTKFDMVYAGAQKNVGPAGVAVVVVKKSFAKKIFTKKVPKPLDYNFQISKESLFNTPPCFSIYIVGEVFKWILKNDGIKGIEQRNRKKADMLYGIIDKYSDFYKGYVANKSERSWMNVCFNLPTEELEKKFIAEALEKDMIGLKGYRELGGIRVSMYNAVSPESIEFLVDFMEKFYQKNK